MVQVKAMWLLVIDDGSNVGLGRIKARLKLNSVLNKTKARLIFFKLFIKSVSDINLICNLKMMSFFLLRTTQHSSIPIVVHLLVLC